MPTSDVPRSTEEILDGLIYQATRQVSGAIVIRGEDRQQLADNVRTLAQAHEVQVLAAVGVEAEADLPYAALHLLLHSSLEPLKVLPEPQADALRGALGMSSHVARPDERFLIGLGTLSLLSELAASESLVCLIEEAQWLDPLSAAALLFAARRLQAEGIALILTADDTFSAPGLPECRSIDVAPQATVMSEAARNALNTGRIARAATLITSAQKLPATPETRAMMAAIQARLTFEQGRPQEAANLLTTGARPIVEASPDQAAWMLIRAVRNAHCAGDPDTATAVGLIEKVRLPAGHPLEILLAVAERVARYLTDGSVDGAPPPYDDVRAAAEKAGGTVPGQLDVAYLVNLLYDYQDASTMAAKIIELCREQGLIGLLPEALLLLASGKMAEGRPREALAAAEEALELTAAAELHQVGVRMEAIGSWAAAVLGDEKRCRELAEISLAHNGLGSSAARATWALCLLDLGFGRYNDVLERLESFGSQFSSLKSAHIAPDLVEAAVRSGQPERAVQVFERFELMLSANRQASAAGVLHRCRAQLAAAKPAPGGSGTFDSGPGSGVGSGSGLGSGPGVVDVETEFEMALTRHNEGNQPFEKARTQLVYGEWLRRKRRKLDARRILREALTGFQRIGARPWADRTLAELRASGEAVASALPESALERLTPQEFQVVQLAAKGATNREIAGKLFLSPKTVGHHLYRAFPKLGVTNRTELARVLSAA